MNILLAICGAICIILALFFIIEFCNKPGIREDEDGNI
jgi:hypothetical protein